MVDANSTKVAESESQALPSITHTDPDGDMGMTQSGDTIYYYMCTHFIFISVVAVANADNTCENVIVEDKMLFYALYCLSTQILLF